MGFEWARTNTAGLKGRPLRQFVTFTAVMGFSLFGYDQGLVSTSRLLDGGSNANK